MWSVDFWLGVLILAAVPFGMAAYGAHVAAETISEDRKRLRVRLKFWGIGLLGLIVAIIYQYRIQKHDDTQQKAMSAWQTEMTNKLDAIRNQPSSPQQKQDAVKLTNEVARGPREIAQTIHQHEIAFLRITRHEIPLITPDKILYAKVYIQNNLDKSFTVRSAYHSFVFRGLDPTADLAEMGSEVWEKDFIPNKLVWSRPTTITTADDQYGEIPIPPLPQEVVDGLNNKSATAAIVLMGIIRKQDDPSAKDVEFCIFFSDPEHIVACSRHN